MTDNEQADLGLTKPRTSATTNEESCVAPVGFDFEVKVPIACDECPSNDLCPYRADVARAVSAIPLRVFESEVVDAGPLATLKRRRLVVCAAVYCTLTSPRGARYLIAHD